LVIDPADPHQPLSQGDAQIDLRLPRQTRTNPSDRTAHITKSPARGRASSIVEDLVYAAIRRRLMPRPTRPRPSRASVPGSGTGAKDS